jgi:hypothetical protein
MRRRGGPATFPLAVVERKGAVGAQFWDENGGGDVQQDSIQA